jgi:hypothetical protein
MVRSQSKGESPGVVSASNSGYGSPLNDQPMGAWDFDAEHPAPMDVPNMPASPSIFHRTRSPYHSSWLSGIQAAPRRQHDQPALHGWMLMTDLVSLKFSAAIFADPAPVVLNFIGVDRLAARGHSTQDRPGIGVIVRCTLSPIVCFMSLLRWIRLSCLARSEDVLNSGNRVR